jgi:hypothetical protein
LLLVLTALGCGSGSSCPKCAVAPGAAGSGSGAAGGSSGGSSVGSSAGGSNAAGSGGDAGTSAGGAGAGGANATGSGGSGGSGTTDASGQAGHSTDEAGAGDAAGEAGVTYLGCTYVGAIDRIVIAKRDVVRDLCFNVVLSYPGQQRQELALPTGFGVEFISVGAASRCPTRVPSSLRASLAVGSIQQASGGGIAGHPTRVNVDVTLTFPANDAGAPSSELLRAQNVDVQPACQ